MVGVHSQKSKATRASATRFRHLTKAAAKAYIDNEISGPSAGQITREAQACLSAAKAPDLVQAGVESRMSSHAREAYRYSMRQRELGTALLQDRAMRRVAPIPAFILHTQPGLLEGIRTAEKSGRKSEFKLKGAVHSVRAIARMRLNVATASERRTVRLIRSFKAAVFTVISVRRMTMMKKRRGGAMSRAARRELVAKTTSWLQRKFPAMLNRSKKAISTSKQATSSKDDDASGPMSATAVAAAALRDFEQIGALVAKLLVAKSGVAHNSGSYAAGGGRASSDDAAVEARPVEVWLWQHSQRDVGKDSLAACSLHRELYAFAADLSKEKATERRKRVAAELQRRCEAALWAVEENHHAMDKTGIFHLDSNQQRTHGAARLALLGAFSLPDADLKVLRELKRESIVTKAEAAAKWAAVAAKKFHAAMEDWETGQRMQLAALRIGDLHKRCSALSIPVPSLSKQQKGQPQQQVLIDAIVAARKPVKFGHDFGKPDRDAAIAFEYAMRVKENPTDEKGASGSVFRRLLPPSDGTSAREGKARRAAAAERNGQALSRTAQERRQKQQQESQTTAEEKMTTMMPRRITDTMNSTVSRKNVHFADRLEEDPHMATFTGGLERTEGAMALKERVSRLRSAVEREHELSTTAAETLSPFAAHQYKLRRSHEVKVRKRNADLLRRNSSSSSGGGGSSLQSLTGLRPLVIPRDHLLSLLPGEAYQQSLAAAEAGVEAAAAGEAAAANLLVSRALQSGGLHETVMAATAAAAKVSALVAVPVPTLEQRAAERGLDPITPSPSTAEKVAAKAIDDEDVGSLRTGELYIDRSSEAIIKHHHDFRLHQGDLDDGESDGAAALATRQGDLHRMQLLRQQRAEEAIEAAAKFDFGDQEADDHDDGSAAFWEKILSEESRPHKNKVASEDDQQHRLSTNSHRMLKSSALLETVPRHVSQPIGAQLPKQLRRGGRILAAQMRPNPDIFRGNEHALGKAREARLFQEKMEAIDRAAWDEDEGYEKPHEHRVNDSGPANLATADVPSSSSGHAAARKFKGPVKKLGTTRKRTLQLFADLEMPTDKQLAFLSRYSSSFDDTELLDKALEQWEEAARFISLREFTLERLGRLERGEWLEPFELFPAEMILELKNKGVWVVPPSSNFHRGKVVEEVQVPVPQNPLVGEEVLKQTSLGVELNRVKNDREKLRNESIAWLRRVLSRVTGKTLAQLRLTDDRFSDTVTFQGQGYATIIASRMAGKSLKTKKKK